MPKAKTPKLSYHSGPKVPSSKARLEDGSLGPRSEGNNPPDAWSFKPELDTGKNQAKMPKTGQEVAADEPLLDQNGFVIDADGNWCEFTGKGFSLKTVPKKTSAEKKAEKKARLASVAANFEVFKPKEPEFKFEDSNFPELKTQVKKKESAPVLCELLPTVPKAALLTTPAGRWEDLQRMEAAPKRPHKERSGAADVTKKTGTKKTEKKSKKLMIKKLKKSEEEELKKSEEKQKQKRKTLSAETWEFFNAVVDAENHEVDPELMDNLLRRTLMDELNSMAAEKNKDLVFKAETFIFKKMNRSFKKARRIQRLDDLKEIVKSQSEKKMKTLFVGMEDVHIMKIFVQTDELLKVNKDVAEDKEVAKDQPAKDALHVKEDVVTVAETPENACLRLRGGDELINHLQEHLIAVRDRRTNLQNVVPSLRPILNVEPRIIALIKQETDMKACIKKLSQREDDDEKEYNINLFDFKAAVHMSNTDKSQCFMTTALRMLLGSTEIRKAIANGMRNSDTTFFKILREAHNQDNADNMLGALRSAMYKDEELLYQDEHRQHDASEFLYRFMDNDEIRVALLQVDCNFITEIQNKCKKGGPDCRTFQESKNDPTLMIQVPRKVDKVKFTMEQLIQKALEDKEVTYPCAEGCGTQEAPFLESKQIVSLPKHLFISASRRMPQLQMKIDTRIYEARKIRIQDQDYILKEVCIHHGSWNSGHYLSLNLDDQRVFNDLWDEKYLTIRQNLARTAEETERPQLNDWSDEDAVNNMTATGTLYYYTKVEDQGPKFTSTPVRTKDTDTQKESAKKAAEESKMMRSHSTQKLLLWKVQ